MSTDWANDEFVRVYKRETADDLMMSWQARALWSAMLIKFDRSGILRAKRGAAGVAVLVHMPLDVVEPALSELLEDGRIQVCEGGFFAKNYMEAQETPRSDKARQRESRQKRHDEAAKSGPSISNAANNHVTRCHTESRAVTPSHDASRAVTLDKTSLDKSSQVKATLAPAADADPTSTGRIAVTAWVLAGKQFAELQHSGIDAKARSMWGALPNPVNRQFQACRALIDELLVEYQHDHNAVIDIVTNRIMVAAAEARSRQTLEFMTPARMWNRTSFDIGAAMTPEQVARRNQRTPELRIAAVDGVRRVENL